MWKKQRKLIINCVRTTADKCELMHKNQAELIPNISVTGGWGGSVVQLRPNCELLEGFRGRRGGEKQGAGKEKEKKFPPDWSSHGLPCRRVSRFQQ